MKKENRLKKRKEFSYIFSHGESLSSKNVVLMLIKSNQKKFKVGFSASKKVGHAVIRNKVKRRIKEAARLNYDKFKVGYNYIFLAKQNSSQAKFDEIKNDVEYLLSKVN